MGLVKYALKFRLTFYVLAILTVLVGGAAVVSMPKDVLPDVDIPVVTIIWTYTGLSAEEMESKITTYTEVSLTNNVTDIANIESQTLQGFAVERVYFQPNVNIDLAIAQTVSAMNSILGILPASINPPIILRYSASQVPVIQLALTSDQLSEDRLYDWGQYDVRQSLATTRGATIPPPFGGSRREIMVDLDMQALQARGLTPADVTNAVTVQNITTPSGLAKFGTTQYVVRLNSSPDILDVLNTIPIRANSGAPPVLLRDVAHVRDGAPPQQNMVRVDGSRSVLMTVLKNGTSSALSVVGAVKAKLGQIQAAAPPGGIVHALFDQSTFVTGAILDVVREGGIAAGLTGLMILLFLGSWRSTLIVLISIPLAILASLTALWALGQTINVMTLGGLALAVGILVDDATVAIENTYRLLDEGRSFREAVVEGGAGIAKPALVSTLSICGAFVSVFFLTDAAKYIFTPQAMAVVFAMLASYLFSRTLVPILIDVLVAGERRGDEGEASEGRPRRRLARPLGLLKRFHRGFERRFERFREGYVTLLRAVLAYRWRTGIAALVVLAGGAGMTFLVGEDYFPEINSDQLQLHVRARPGLRIESAEAFFQQVENTIREVIPPDELDVILDNIGLPQQNYNLAFMDNSTNAYYDGPIMIALKPGHAPTRDHMRTLRRVLMERFPDGIFYFQAPDIITQVLNFGLPAPIDIQITGRDRQNNMNVARDVLGQVKGVKGAVDTHIHQILDAPQLFLTVDRVRAQQLGLSEEEIANNLDVALSSSYQTAPNFWSDPLTRIPYQIAVQTPEYRVDTLPDLSNTPLLRGSDGQGNNLPATLLSNVASLSRRGEQTVQNHVNTRPAYDIYASVQDRDLGAVERDLRPIVQAAQARLKPGNQIAVRGQIESKNTAFANILLALAAAFVAVYLLMVVNFQDWGDPFVVLLALPIGFCGIVTALFVTGTTFSIPSLMGAIMAVGVASANSILLVTFAREHRVATGCDAAEAAITAGATRLRPVLMTAGAMIVGLLPMSLALGAGSEQNAVLARSVIGGVAVGTCSTLLLVPFLYSLLRRGKPRAVEDYA